MQVQAHVASGKTPTEKQNNLPNLAEMTPEEVERPKVKQLESIHNWRPSDSLRNAYVHTFHACIINYAHLMLRYDSCFGQSLKIAWCTISCILWMTFSHYHIQVHLSICKTDWVIAIFVLDNIDYLWHIELG